MSKKLQETHIGPRGTIEMGKAKESLLFEGKLTKGFLRLQRDLPAVQNKIKRPQKCKKLRDSPEWIQGGKFRVNK